MCDLRPWRLGLPGWVPKSLVSPLHLKFSCRIWDTSSWHWIPLGSTSLTGSDTPSHSVTPLPPSHTHPASNHWGLCLYPRLQWPPVSHDHSSPSSLPFASETALGCLQSAFLCLSKRGHFCRLVQRCELHSLREARSGLSAQVCLAGDGWRDPGRRDLGEAGGSVREGSSGPK